MFWKKRRRHDTTHQTPRTIQTPDAAPTQSPDFVRAEFDDTVSELAAPIVAKIEETTEKDTNATSVTVIINIPDEHSAIAPQTVALAAAQIANTRGIHGTFTMHARKLNFIFT